MSRQLTGRVVLGIVLLCCLLAPLAQAKTKNLSVPWPPKKDKGTLFVHFGEEHINDDDGRTLLPKVVADSALYKPSLVTMSGDKVNKGEVAELKLWADVMAGYDKSKIPWFAGVGNHDRCVPDSAPGECVDVMGVPPIQDFSTYSAFFASRPWPMGDGAVYGDKSFEPRQRPAGDPAGAASYYFVDYGPVRWIFIDNSCWSITLCDSPGVKEGSGQQQGDEGELAFMSRVAAAAKKQGRLAFVVMHMPTRDPRDTSYAEPTSLMHTMGKGPAGTKENADFEAAAASSGVDGVFVAHIKGQFLYTGQGGIPYFIDGGAGGELYTTGPVGVDHGYWHGYRLIRVADDHFKTDAVPIFIPGAIKIEGPKSLALGQVTTFAAFGRQPVFNDPAKVEALELRDPAPKPKSSSASALASIGKVGLFAGVPLLLLLITGLLVHSTGAMRRIAFTSVVVVGFGGLAGGVSLAQQGTPTSTPVASLPNPARIWTTSNARVLQPVASKDDDSRRKEATQTADGSFRAVCPGKAKLEIASGWASKRQTVVVRRRSRGRLLKSLRWGENRITRGERARVATVDLNQPAVVQARVFRDGKRVDTLLHRCVTRESPFGLRWNGVLGKRKKKRLAAPGDYKLVVKVRSEKRPTVAKQDLTLE